MASIMFQYYTVVRNVKKAHQIQEIGEFQEFNDDVEYLLDACQVSNQQSPLSNDFRFCIFILSVYYAIPDHHAHLVLYGWFYSKFSDVLCTFLLTVYDKPLFMNYSKINEFFLFFTLYSYAYIQSTVL